MISAPRIAALLAAGYLAAAVLAGCVQGPGTDSTVPEPDISEPSALARQGRHEEAAAAWLAEAARAPAENAPALRLRAADAWWKAGDSARAGETARAIDPAGLNAGDRTRRSLLLARAFLARSAEEDAFAALPSIEEMLALPEPAAALEIAVRTARGAGRTRDEIRFRAALDPRLADPGANRAAIWSLVRSLPVESLAVGLPETPGRPGGTAAGWLELGRLAHAHRVDFPAFSTAILRWRTRYPGHPAEASIAPGLTEEIRRKSAPPRHVALLLPLSGTFASAAAAVRDGFLAAWYVEGSKNRPVVSVHDTRTGEPDEVFRRAVAEGADFVVGPLRKKAIGHIAALADRAAPVLLLNALDIEAGPPAEGPPVYQFALSPEDEARAVASFARRNGHRRAGLLVPETDWGARVADAFTEEWEASGASVVVRAAYRGAAEDLAQPVRDLLGVDASETRAGQLRRVLRRSIAHEPFPRDDLDFVFLAGFPREARLLRPQIIFLRAPDLPIYATSHVFAGVPEPQHDLDLDGVVFNDMPWVLSSASDEDALRERVLALWPAATEGFIRYYAFGADAYRLQRWMFRLADRPGEAAVTGRTGRLTVGADARVRIEMDWARFRNGVPEPITQ